MKPDLYEHVTMTLTWGCDEAQQVFEHLEARRRGAPRRGERTSQPGAAGRTPAAGDEPRAPESPISPKPNEPME